MDGQRDAPATKEDLDQVERKLTARIDGVEQKLTTKIDANAGKIDANGKKIEINAAKIDNVEKRLTAKIDGNSATLDRVARQVVDNHEQIGRLLIMGKEFKEYFNEILGTLDGLASGFAQLDQERVATNTRFDRVEKDVDKNKGEMKKIKTKLAMP